MTDADRICSHSALRLTWRTALLVFTVALTARTGWGWMRISRAPDTAVLEQTKLDRSEPRTSVRADSQRVEPLVRYGCTGNALEFPDEEQYWLMASSFAEGDGLRDELGFRATRMPLYPAFLSLFADRPNGIVFAKIAQWVMGSLAACFTAGLGASLRGHRVGCAAGLLVALDPFLIFFSSLLLTETLFITALCGLWWALAAIMRYPRSGPLWRWIAVGVISAACVYLRESSVGLLLIALPAVALLQPRNRRHAIGAAMAIAIVVASLVPWAVRNQSLTGQWCWLTLRGGISLYDGVRPAATGASDLGDVKQSPEVVGLAEPEWDHYFRDRALEIIRADPIRILRLAGVKLLRMWNPVPNVETYQSGAARMVSLWWTVPTFGLALAGLIVCLVRDRRCAWGAILLLLLPAVYFSLLHSLFVGSVRYRLPATPMIEVLAAVALISLFQRGSAPDDKLPNRR